MVSKLPELVENVDVAMELVAGRLLSLRRTDAAEIGSLALFLFNFDVMKYSHRRSASAGIWIRFSGSESSWEAVVLA